MRHATPTPGKGPTCPVLRCTSVLVTGDMLVHAQPWEQAGHDAAAAGKPGLDFVPLLEGQRRRTGSGPPLAGGHAGCSRGLGNGIMGLSPWYVVNNEGLLARGAAAAGAHELLVTRER